MTEEKSFTTLLAGRIFAALVTSDRNRSLADRDEDIEHSLAIADELVRRYKLRHGEVPEPTPEASPTPRNRVVAVDRDEGALAVQRADRQASKTRH